MEPSWPKSDQDPPGCSWQEADSCLSARAPWQVLLPAQSLFSCVRPRRSQACRSLPPLDPAAVAAAEKVLSVPTSQQPGRLSPRCNGRRPPWPRCDPPWLGLAPLLTLAPASPHPAVLYVQAAGPSLPPEPVLPCGVSVPCCFPRQSVGSHPAQSPTQSRPCWVSAGCADQGVAEPCPRLYSVPRARTPNPHACSLHAELVPAPAPGLTGLRPAEPARGRAAGRSSPCRMGHSETTEARRQHACPPPAPLPARGLRGGALGAVWRGHGQAWAVPPRRPRALSPGSPLSAPARLSKLPSLSLREGFRGHFGVHVGISGEAGGSPHWWLPWRTRAHCLKVCPRCSCKPEELVLVTDGVPHWTPIQRTACTGFSSSFIVMR